MPTHVTLYFAAPPSANNTTLLQIPATSTNKGTSSDVRVVNFALTAETLERELYRQVLARLTTGGTTDGLGQPITGLGLSTSEQDVSFVTEFFQVETVHRDFLATQLYGSPEANPFLPNGALGLVYAFSTPDGTVGVGNFSRVQCIQSLYLSEERGISGYLAGSRALSVVPGGNPFLKIAAAALGVEGRHASSYGNTLTQLGVPTETAPLANQNGGRDEPLDPDAILYLGGSVPGGTLPPVSGPNGYVYKAA